LLNLSYALGTKRQEKTLFHLRCNKLGPKDIQLFARRFFKQLNWLYSINALDTK